MLLRKLMDGRSDAEIIVLEDTIEAVGKIHLLCFVKALLQRLSEVHVICLEIGIFEAVQSRTEFANESRLHIHRPPLEDLFDFSTFLSQNVKGEGDFAIVIDGLSTLLFYHDAGTVINSIILHAFGAKYKSGGKLRHFIGMVHSDVTEKRFVQELEFISNGIVRISPSKESKFPLVSSVFSVYKTKVGKLKTEVEDYKMSLDPLDILTVPKPQIQPQPSTSKSHIKTLTSQLPFALDLREEEMRTRSQLVLPYTRVMDMPDGEEESELYVEDEEDPDGDLEV